MNYGTHVLIVNVTYYRFISSWYLYLYSIEVPPKPDEPIKRTICRLHFR